MLVSIYYVFLENNFVVEYKSLFSIELDDKTVEKCAIFAGECVETNIDEYKRRRQFNKTKIIGDIKTGKIAECAAFSFFQNNGFNVVEPDFKIYTARKKNFNSDIIASKSNKEWLIHVKSQRIEQSEKYGISWMFQKQDKLITKPKSLDVLFLCLVKAHTVDVIGIHKAKDITDIYGEPKLTYLTSKAALYYEDINRKNFENQDFLLEMGIES